MAYLGNSLTVQQYAPTITYFNGNGSQTVFTLPIAVVSAAQILVVVGNVPQNPATAFTVSGTTITFTSAPPSGTNNIWVEYTSLTTAVSIPPSGYSEFAAGTALLFNQTTAPTGWTKVTTNTDAALRVVSGTVGTGGTVAFSTAFASQAVSGSIGATTLTSSQIPAHTHNYSNTTGYVSNDHNHDPNVAVNNGGGSGYQRFNYNGENYNCGIYSGGWSTSGISANHYHSFSGTTDNGTGGGGSHTHSFTGTAINLAVKYVDVIIATKN